MGDIDTKLDPVGEVGSTTAMRYCSQEQVAYSLACELSCTANTADASSIRTIFIPKP